MDPRVDSLFRESGAAGWGKCAFSDLPIDGERLERAERLCPKPAGVFIAAYPYYGGDIPGNLSLYARGEDYHSVLLRRLGAVCEGLRALYPDHAFVPGSDNSPLPERETARLAGLGLMGKNGLVIVPPYGSYVFLGTILTDLPLPTEGEPAGECLNCDACVRACPGGALREHPFDEGKCLSALTQKKGELTPAEEALLREHPLIWGCDICQRVCPYNRTAELSPLTDLTGRGEELPYLASLSEEDLEGLSGRGFQRKFSGRAFTWRGIGVLRRNLALRRDGEDGR